MYTNKTKTSKELQLVCIKREKDILGQVRGCGGMWNLRRGVENDT